MKLDSSLLPNLMTVVLNSLQSSGATFTIYDANAVELVSMVYNHDYKINYISGTDTVSFTNMSSTPLLFKMIDTLGTATKFIFKDGSNNIIFSGSVGITGDGSDIQLTTNMMTPGKGLEIVGLTIKFQTEG